MAQNGGDSQNEPVAEDAQGGTGGGAKDPALTLFQQHLDLVQIVARQIFSHIDALVEMEELLSAGREGLFEAARRFDPKHGVAFRTFANYRVRGAVLDAVRKASWLPRRSQDRLLALQAAGIISEGAVSNVFVDIDAVTNGISSLATLDDHFAALAVGAELRIEADSVGATSSVRARSHPS